MHNAWLRSLRPVSTVAGTDDLDRVYTEEQQPRTRCRVVRASGTRVALAFGIAGVEAYTVRLVTAEPIEAGWQVEMLLDGEDDWHGYTVMGRDGRTHCCLTVRRN